MKYKAIYLLMSRRSKIYLMLRTEKCNIPNSARK